MGASRERCSIRLLWNKGITKFVYDMMITNGMPKWVRRLFKDHTIFPLFFFLDLPWHCLLRSIPLHPPWICTGNQTQSMLSSFYIGPWFLIYAFSSAAYSLSGHVCISVSSSSQTTARLLLQSLSLTFEGQSEVLIACTGYSSLRLCSITRELTPKPIELSNEGSGGTCTFPIHPQLKFNSSSIRSMECHLQSTHSRVATADYNAGQRYWNLLLALCHRQIY